MASKRAVLLAAAFVICFTGLVTVWTQTNGHRAGSTTEEVVAQRLVRASAPLLKKRHKAVSEQEFVSTEQPKAEVLKQKVAGKIKTSISSAKNSETAVEGSKVALASVVKAAGGGSDLKDVLKQLENLEARLKEVEVMVPKKYPDVVFLNDNEKKRILITGGAGFVGSHLTDRLMLAGHDVVVVDNFFTGRKRNVEHWVGHQNFELIHHDIVNPIFIEVDQVYHLASPASPPHYMYNPVKTIKTNTVGTINVLGLARRVGATVLIASTSEVYGDPEVHPQKETYWGHVNPIGPRACYDEAKRVSETLAYAYQKQEQVTVRVARIFNTYGPRMHMSDGRVVSNFIVQSLLGKDVTVYGDGNQTRSFQYVTDLVDGLVRLMNSNYSLPVNLGNPEEHTIDEFAHIIQQQVGGDLQQHTHLPPVEDDPQKRKPDISRAKAELDWEPLVPLATGIQKTVDYFRQELTRSTVNHDEDEDHQSNYVESLPDLGAGVL